jgi:hypothetical protein
MMMFFLMDAREDAAPDALAGDLGKEPFDEVEPRRRRGLQNSH